MKKITSTFDFKSVLLGLVAGIFLFSVVGFQNIEQGRVYEDCEYRYQAVPFGESGLIYYDTKTGDYLIDKYAESIKKSSWTSAGKFQNSLDEVRFRMKQKK